MYLLEAFAMDDFREDDGDVIKFRVDVAGNFCTLICFKILSVSSSIDLLFRLNDVCSNDRLCVLISYCSPFEVIIVVVGD